MSLPADPQNPGSAFCSDCNQSISIARVAAHLVSKKHTEAAAATAKRAEEALHATFENPPPPRADEKAKAPAKKAKAPKSTEATPATTSATPATTSAAPATAVAAPAKKAKSAATSAAKSAATSAATSDAAPSKKAAKSAAAPAAAAPAAEATGGDAKGATSSGAAAPKKAKASAKEAKTQRPIELPADPNNAANVWCAICKQSVARARGAAHLATDKHAAAATKYLQTTMTTAPPKPEVSSGKASLISL